MEGEAEMRISLNRLRVDKQAPHLIREEKQICEFTMNAREYRKLSREIQDINNIYAGGRQNRRYKLVTQ